MKKGELCPFLPNFSSFVHQGGEEILSLTSTRKADKKKIDRFVVLCVLVKNFGRGKGKEAKRILLKSFGNT